MTSDYFVDVNKYWNYKVWKVEDKMKDIKLYIEVVYYKDGTSSCNVYREYVKHSGSIKYDSLGIFKNNFLGMIRAKRRLTKFKKFHKRHKFDEVRDYSIVEKVIY